MIKLMETLFIVSLYGSLLVMLILLVKILLKEKLNPKFHYYIWVLLIIKLIVPYGLKSNFSVFNLMNPIMEKREITKNSIVKAVPNSIPILKNEDTDSPIHLDTIGEISKGKCKVNYKVILLYIWFMGMTGILTFILHGVWKIKCIKKSAYNKKFENFNKILNDFLYTMHIKKRVKLLYTDKISSPCIWGFIKPVIFMPINVVESISEEEFKYTLLHELVHLKRKDILINWIIIFLNTIYWFNPVIRYGFYKMKQDCEISCDAYALTYLNEEENLDYGNSIIKILQLGDQLNPLIGTTSMISNKSEIKRRIIMVSRFKKLSWKGILFGLSVIIIIGTVGLTNPVSKAGAIDTKIDNWNKTVDDETRFNPIDENQINDLKKESKAQIASLDWTGYKEYWSSLCKNNIYTAEFKIFSGTERYVINEKEVDYNLKIDSNINEGSLTIKVYTDKKIMFEKNNPKEESMRISKEDAANIKIECIGTNASGYLKFEVN